MNLYKCDLIKLEDRGDSFRAIVNMREDHKAAGGRTGELTTTSAIKSIDFERGLIVTQNSIYNFDTSSPAERLNKYLNKS